MVNFSNAYLFLFNQISNLNYVLKRKKKKNEPISLSLEYSREPPLPLLIFRELNYPNQI